MLKLYTMRNFGATIEGKFEPRRSIRQDRVNDRAGQGPGANPRAALVPLRSMSKQDRIQNYLHRIQNRA